MKALFKAVLGASINPALALSIIILGATSVAGASLTYASFNPYVAQPIVHNPPSKVLGEMTIAQVSGTLAPRVGELVYFEYNGNNTVFLVGDNGLYGFPNLSTFLSWGFSFSNVLPANSAEQALPVLSTLVPTASGCSDPLDQINGTCVPLPGAYLGLRVGQLVYNPGSQTVYLVASNGLYGFPNLATFQSWGFNFNQVVVENTAEQSAPYIGLVPMAQSGCASPLSQIAGTCAGSTSPTPTPPSSSTSGARIGQLVYNPGSQTVYLVGQNGLYGFTSLAIFQSWGFSFSQVLVENPSELSLSMIGTVPAPQSGCNNPLDQIAGTCAGSTSPTPTPPINSNPCISATGGSCGANSGSSQGPVSVSGLTPQFVQPGATVLVTGTGFTSTGNTVDFWNAATQQQAGTVSGLSSADGMNLLVTLPSSVVANCTASNSCSYAPLYVVTVTNANGTSDTPTTFSAITYLGGNEYTGPYVLTVTTPSTDGYPQVTSLVLGTPSPSSGPVGTVVSLPFMDSNEGDLLTINGMPLSWTASYGGSKGNSFVVPPLPIGTYSLAVENMFGTSNAVNFTITTSPAPAISAITPLSCWGSNTTISGSGFLPSGNVVNFGTTASVTVAGPANSQQESILTVPIPNTLIPGSSYPVTVTNSSGASQQFSVFLPDGGCPPAITSLNSANNPTVAGGSTLTITGYQFAPTGNTVTFYGAGGSQTGSVSNLSSSNNGTIIKVTVPSTSTIYTLIVSNPYYPQGSNNASMNVH